MKKFVLIGHPLGHSMSPFIHKLLMSEAGIDGTYELLDISPENLKEQYSVLSKLDGFNVTIPNKIPIIPFLNSLSDKAELFGAVNTVDAKKGKGYNTDCIGFLRATQLAKIEIAGRIVICGAGGVARMICFECAARSDDVTLAVRESTMEKAKVLQCEIEKKLGKIIKVSRLSDLSGKSDLLINGTPVGMLPNVDEMPVSESFAKNAKCVFDTIYNPSPTRLLRVAKAGGAIVSDGTAMLVCQAAAAQEIWNDTVSFSDECIEKIIRKIEKELKK